MSHWPTLRIRRQPVIVQGRPSNGKHVLYRTKRLPWWLEMVGTGGIAMVGMGRHLAGGAIGHAFHGQCSACQ